MTALTWDAVGEHVFETGVDRGVLYVNGAAVPWVGLVSVSESTSGGDRTPFYIDGVMYLNLAADTEFSAKLEAFTYPDEFGVCDGTADAGDGLFITNQEREQFNLVYRTRVGNEVDSWDHGYKIHIVYNAYAAPAEVGYSTIGDSVEPITFSWDLSTLPIVVPGYKPTSHFIIDSRKTSPEALEYLEGLLYGRDGDYPQPAYLPSFEELIYILRNPIPSLDFWNAGGPEDMSPWALRDAGGPASIADITADGGTIVYDPSLVNDPPGEILDGGGPSSSDDPTVTILDGGVP